MHPALWISKTGLDAQQMNVQVTSNNLANVETVAFKKGRAIFDDLLYQKVRQAGAENGNNAELPSGLMLGTGVRVAGTEKNFQQGNPNRTDNPNHIAINGRGFFQVLRSDGTTAYTRDGEFSISSTGALTTNEGLLLQPSITIPPSSTNLSIGHDGTVSINLAGSVAPTQVGSIQLVDFINYSGLEPIGDNLYIETAASGAAQSVKPAQNGAGELLQGYLESSNVNVVEELINLIQGQRAYEINARSVETADKMLQFITQML